MKKPALVFLHGFPFNGSSWDEQVLHFKDEFEVFAPDLRGHREGPSGPGPWFTHHLVEDLKDLLDREGVERAVVCGLSMGGYVALHFAQKYGERLRGLVLADTRGDADSNETKDKRFATVEKIHRDPAAFAEEFSRTVLSERTLAEKPELQARVAAMIRGNQPANVAMLVALLASRRDSTPFLGQIRCPTLVMVGEHDVPTPVAANEALARAIPGAEFHLVPGAGHMSNIENPGEFNRRLETWLGKLGR